MAQTSTNLNGELVSKEVEECLKQFLNQQGIKQFTVDISAGSIRGDNYLGIVASVLAKGVDQNGQDTSHHFIIKSAPKNENCRKLAAVRELYGREIYMYNTVFPEFYKLQEARCVLNPFKSLPVCYASCFEDCNEAVIMKNMKECGYKLQDRHLPLDYDHVLLVLKEYGRFHALSYALRDQNPQLFKEIAKNTQDLFAIMLEEDDYIQKQTEAALVSLDPIKDKIAYEKFQNYRKNCVSLVTESLKEEPAGKYAVIGHGDSWMNNMLFKYANASTPNIPTDLCFLDFQLARCGSPVHDLSYFLFTCSDKKLREEHYTDLIKEYYKSLSSFLRELGSDPDKLFPFEVLQQHLKKFSVYGFYMAGLVIHLMTSEVDEIPDWHNAADYEDINELFNYKSKNEDKYHERIRDVILDFIKYGYDF